MTYSTIQPPFSLQFKTMSKRELHAYRDWFHHVMPDRLSELTRAVKDTPGYHDWSPSFSPESLGPLGHWLEGQVHTRKKTPREIEEDRAQLVFPIDVPNHDLTSRSLSLAIDVGMYFARVVLENLHGTYWDQPLTNNKFADYGQPVIIGFGPIPLNPVRVVVTTAYGIAKGKPAQLYDLYATWARMKR